MTHFLNHTSSQLLEQELSLFFNGPVVLMRWGVTPVRPIIYASPNMEECFGYDHELLVIDQVEYLSLVHPDDLPGYKAVLEEFVNNEDPGLQTQYRLRGADNRYRWVSDRQVAVRDKRGKTIHFYGYIEDIQQHKDAELYAEHLSYHDSLTSLPNRRMLVEQLQQECARAKRHGYVGGVLYLDIDHFKNINDTLGHEVGDELLKEVGRRCKVSVRSEDIVARMGGDEFVIMLPMLGDTRVEAERGAIIAAEKIRISLSKPYKLGEQILQNTPSIGVALYPEADEVAENYIKHAETAMYQVKENGRCGVTLYNPEQQQNDRSLLEHDLRRSIAEGGLALFFQPQVNQHGLIVSAEVLLRWNHPVRGMVYPNDFIPIAEESGLIIPIGEWVLVQACMQFKNWREKQIGLNVPACLAVNVSPRQFHQYNFVDVVKHAIRQSGIQPHQLELELTEGLIVTDVEDTIHKMQQLKHMGVRISLDDFGTGYSSLSYLKRLPVDMLKIDRSFVTDITNGLQDQAIVDTIISMSKHMEMMVIAEGVETLEEREILFSKGCNLYQGFYFSRPLPLGEFEALLLNKPKW